MADVFISYHVASAADIVRQIGSHLKRCGISCWYSEDDVPSGKYFAEIVPREIDACRIFLLVLDEGANQSFHVINEVELAVKRKARGENIEIIPFYMLKGPVSDALRYNLTQFQRVDGRSPPIDARIRDLTSQIRERLDIITPPSPIPRPKTALRRQIAAFLMAVLILCSAILYAVWYRSSIKDPLAEGEKAYHLAQYQIAVEWLTKAAEQGTAEALFLLGQCYQEGYGVEQDKEQAQIWYAEAVKAFEVAAGDSSPDAMYRLGVCYGAGLGVPADEEVSWQWYWQAAAIYNTEADKGNIEAILQLGYIYEYGYGNILPARIWYQKAAEAGSVDGMYETGRVFWQDYGDMENGVKWLMRAADAGNTDAMEMLCAAYMSGANGLTRDMEKALSWLNMASSAGDVRAMRTYYCLCRDADRADDSVAVKWLETATEFRDSDSAALLGDHYFFAYDKSLFRDYKKAAQWYKVSAELGNQYAVDRMAVCCRYGLGTELDVQKAQEWEAMLDSAPVFVNQAKQDNIDEAHTEALNYVLSLGAISAYQDGAVPQKQGMTRGIAAKLFAYLKLGPRLAPQIPTNVTRFPDVLPDTVFSGYITWCVDNSVLNGLADGTFRPNDPISDYGFESALLKLFGYGVPSDYTGSEWRKNVGDVNDALGTGGNLSSQLITIEDAALMILSITRDCAKPN